MRRTELSRDDRGGIRVGKPFGGVAGSGWLRTLIGEAEGECGPCLSLRPFDQDRVMTLSGPVALREKGLRLPMTEELAFITEQARPPAHLAVPGS